ncbi:hypothetical protein MCOR25_000394 [Pyricularia grisea]|nr:hypothetical protein MCOR25_000394 [Pyricularia grisea]
MRKPDADFAFRPANNITSDKEVLFCISRNKQQASKQHLEHALLELIAPRIHRPSSINRAPRRHAPAVMVRSRSASFSDDDIQFVSSQMLAEAAKSQPKSPLQSSQGNRDVIDITGSPAPEFGRPTNMNSKPQPKAFSSLYKKEKKQPNVFLQPRNRPEHHRGTKVSGPSALKYNDIKAPPLPLYNSLPAQRDSTTAGSSAYTQSAAFDDNVFYTDPKKANDDLKALLEGGMDEEEQGENKEEGGEAEKIDDGSLEGITVKLLPHQQEGVEWMKGRELGPVKRGKVPKGGILADDMGLGKTLQSISLIVSSPKPNKDEKGWKKHYDGIGKGTLVVAPLALIRQWEAEIAEKVLPSHKLNVCVHHGPSRTKRYTDLQKYDVVITTYQILVSEYGHSTDAVGAGCFGIHWFRVILDEAHSIKNRNAKATKACCALRSEFRWCLTGTPMQNNLDELQSLVSFLRIPPYDDLKHWREYIDQPMKNGKGHLAIRRLHSLLRCFMKRRTKDVLKEEGALNPGGKKALEAAAKKGDGQMPPAPAFKVTERKVVTVTAEFSPAERKFYNRLEDRADESLQRMMKGKVNYANALVLLLRLRQACNHPRLVGIKMEKEKDALSMDTAQPVKSATDADVDALADMFGGMGVESKQCDVCMSNLSKDEVSAGKVVCEACDKDRAAFNNEGPDRRRSKKIKKKVIKEEVKVEAKSRKARHRPAVLDSDDEEDDGSWIVGEDQRGSLRLGKAGGEEDENCEGGGEWLNTEDSIHHSEDEDGSRLDSFIVDDEKEDRSRTQNPDSEEDSSLVSVSKLASKQGSQQADSDSGSGSGSETDSDLDSGVDESEYDSADDAFAHEENGRVVPSAKIRQLLEILHKEVHEHKFIVFSQFTSMLDLVAPFFDREGFKYTRYEGSMKNDLREESLHSLRNDPKTRILLCSLKCGSLGLNLTAATRVVILEPFWNPFVEEQAIDRVHRLTQTVDVIVYKLTVGKSVEERILELQNKKRLLAEQAIEGGMKKKDALKLGLQEMLALFTRDRSSDIGSVVDAGGRESIGSSTGTRKPVRPPVPSVFERRW